MLSLSEVANRFACSALSCVVREASCEALSSLSIERPAVEFYKLPNLLPNNDLEVRTLARFERHHPPQRPNCKATKLPHQLIWNSRAPAR